MMPPPQVLRVLAAELTTQHGKEPVPEGTHAINYKIRLALRGSVVQEPPRDVTPTLRIPTIATLALFAEMAGISARRAEDLLYDAIVEALSKDEKASDWLEHSRAAERRVKQWLQTLPKQPQSGPLKRILTIENLHVDGASLRK